MWSFAQVVAKRDLVTDEGEQVFKGTHGKLTERIGKSQMAVARFVGFEDEVYVELSGCPELEKDVDIVYDSKSERKKHLRDPPRRRRFWDGDPSMFRDVRRFFSSVLFMFSCFFHVFSSISSSRPVNRLFVALLWSDPVGSKEEVGRMEGVRGLRTMSHIFS